MCLQQESSDKNNLKFIKFVFLAYFSFRSIISRKSESLNNLVFSFPAKLLEIIESQKEDKNTKAGFLLAFFLFLDACNDVYEKGEDETKKIKDFFTERK